MPEPGPGWALVRVEACGVCGSDFPRIFEKGAYSFPLIPGHEMSGTIERIADAESPLIASSEHGVPRRALKPGDRVVVFPLIPCGACEPCHAGLNHLCDDYDYLGSRRDGGFAEYVTAPVENLLPVPNGVSLDAAAMAEPCAVALHALRRGGVDAGDVVWIVGAGTIGLILAQLVWALGASRVLVSDIDREKLALASKWSGVSIVNVAENDPVKWVMDATGGRGADLVVEAVGIPATVRQSVMGARKRGTVVLMGNPASDITLPQKDYWQILRRELTVQGTWNSSYGGFPKDEWKTVLDMMAAGRLDLEPLITHRVSLSDLPAMLERARAGKEFYIKILAKAE